MTLAVIAALLKGAALLCGLAFAVLMIAIIVKIGLD
jgi:hypothetical protein